MKRPQAFDELARRKLEERAFPFDEAHWEAMQRLIRSEGRKRRATLVRSTAILLLLLIGGGLVWFLSGDKGTPLTSADVKAGQEGITEQPAPSPTMTGEQANHDQRDEANQTSTDIVPASPNVTSAPGTGTPVERSDKSHAAPSTGAKSEEHGTVAPKEDPSVAPVVILQVNAPSDQPSTGVADDGSHGSEAGVTPAMMTAEPDAGNMSQNESGVSAPEAGTAVAATMTSDPVDQQASSTSSDAQEVPGTMRTDASGSPAATNDPQQVAATSSTDNTGIPAQSNLPAMQVTDLTYLELSLLGGVMQTHTTYGGAATESWDGTISDASSPSIGAELMFMKEHWGYGSGLHYTTYTEHLQLDEQYADRTELYYTHTFTQVDTTVLNVIDTIMVGDTAYYVTQPVDVTIWVLDTDVDTSTITVVTREPVDQINRVSYVELPLLGDVHTSAGHWQFGVRGGLTIGMLTERRGSIPTGPGGGMVAFEDQQFRTTTLGYVARPYVRYLIGDAWMIGIEPCLRGQLLDSDASEDLSRRSWGMGMMGSVSMRLR